MSLLNWLKLPDTLEIKNLDDPSNIYALRKIIKRKPFLHNLYEQFYAELLSKAETASPGGEFVELGSGAGFIKELAPYVVTSDVLPYEGVDRLFSALNMPLQDLSVSAFLMLEVLHHVKEPRQLFKEMRRCLKVGGKIVMIEPANTVWSRFIYTNFHSEPFVINKEGDWSFSEGGPLSGANIAIPWMMLCRDYAIFIKEFPELRISFTRIHTPFSYLLSGGLSFRQLMPSFLYPEVKMLEWLLTPLNKYLGIFMTIELEKIKMPR